MKTIIEIGVDKAKIVQYQKTKIKGSKEFDLDFIGSYLTDLATKLKATNWKMKNVTLLVNNNDVLYREMTLPDIEQKKLVNIIANELKSSSINNDTYISDYIELSKEDKKVRVLTGSVTKACMESYIDFSKSANFKSFDKIDVAYNALFNYFAKTDLSKDKDAKLLVDVSNRFMKFYLFEEGTFVLVRTIRFTGSGVFTQTVGQISDEISKMLQFQISRHTGFDIKGVYFFGDHEELNSIIAYIKESTDVPCAEIPKVKTLETPVEFNYLRNIYAIGSLVRK